MENIRHIDSYDIKIIRELMQDGRLPVTELAKRIGMSKSPCQARLKRLQSEGYILGFRAQVDYSKLNQEQVAFAEVKMSDTREEALIAFNNAVKDLPEIEECHLIAGSFDYLLKVRTPDINTYRKVLGESISSLPNVASTSTYVSMQSIKDSNS
jgi:Lrp/AsnC family leucine-responsive transcriptional regulator